MTVSTRLDRRALMAGTLALAGGLILPPGTRSQSNQGRTSAMIAAEELSVMEAQTHLPALYEFYARLHPDGQEIIPRHVVIGWYQDNWHPKGPHPATATGASIVTWTWPVNGVAYSNVYEVSYIQEFDNAPTRNDVVRLVYVEPYFRWFFGRSKAFVDEQIAFYNAEAYIPQGGDVPYDLQRVVNSEPEVVQSLPIQIGDAQATLITDARQLPDYAASMPLGVQYKSAEYPVGYARATILASGYSMAGTIQQIVDDGVETPPFRLISWNLDPANAVPFAHFEQLASEAVGNAQTIVWGSATGRTLWEISFVNVDDLETLAAALIAMASIA